jgi:hypothetical protein
VPHDDLSLVMGVFAMSALGAPPYRCGFAVLSKCALSSSCAGSPMGAGFYRVWGAVITPAWSLARPCLPWTSCSARRQASVGMESIGG